MGPRWPDEPVWLVKIQGRGISDPLGKIERLVERNLI